ncbi:MAG TPA: Na/Pi cotransporter family protein [Rhodobacteraceae bacterium]|nr:Na/Pi cotransporter family protein [Paracoccaceae bacterium]
MDGQWIIVLGGVGMFLLGMHVMTTALREAAGSSLRRLLARFTTTPLRGAMTGAGATALIQSSSATTVMTVGFVGAGLMTMPQALGIIYGANIGTTATGWLVSLLGFKLQLDQVAMFALPLAALALLLGRGGVVRAAQVLAGLCLILIGLELMQQGMEGVTGWITPDRLPGDSLGGRLALAGLGLVVTVMVQSSSAAMALALVMLQGGAISLIQAACIVIGMNIGTTFTAILASIGGARPMRQAAVANLLFNIAISLLAFPVLMLGAGALETLAEVSGPLTALLLFHTGFNVAGALIFLPLTPAFARLVARLVPAEADEPLVALDRSLLSDSAAALPCALSASQTIARSMFRALSRALRDPSDFRAMAAAQARLSGAIDELEAYLAEIRLPRERPDDAEAYSALLHQIDHLRRLLHRMQTREPVATVLEDETLRGPALVLGQALDRAVRSDADMRAARLARLERIVADRTERHRRGLLLGEHAGLHDLRHVFSHTDAMRWLRRTLHHAERIAHYDQVARAGIRPGPQASVSDQSPGNAKSGS